MYKYIPYINTYILCICKYSYYVFEKVTYIISSFFRIKNEIKKHVSSTSMYLFNDERKGISK